MRTRGNLDNSGSLRSRVLPVDIIRTVAMFGVILLHAAGQWIISSQQFSQLNTQQMASWAIVDVYQTLGVLGVPIFLMLTGALLLQPQKHKEDFSVFFKKRWARIGLPFFFWAVVYFVWDFLVQKIPFSSGVILQGLLNGTYTQFWYIYVLVGLYLLTPLLRNLLSNADQALTLMKYFIILWVIGVAILPFLALLSPFNLNNNVFAIGGYVGFFVLGTYLTTVKMRRTTILTVMLLGIALIAFSTYVLFATEAAQDIYFFQEYISPTVILTSSLLFLLLLTFKDPADKSQSKFSAANRLIKTISANTLPIFFLHVIVLESLENGYLGFAINRFTINPIIEVPLLTVIVLFVTLGIVLLLKRVRYLSKLIG